MLLGFPRVQMREQVVDREVRLAGLALPPEYDARPALHADRRVDRAPHAQAPPRDRVDQDALVLRALQLARREQVVPVAEPADVLVLRRSVFEVEKGWRAATHHRTDQPERERIGDAPDRRPE